MADGHLRFLLDQNFPKPSWDVHQLDRTVSYEHIADWDLGLVARSTPDWLVQLAAHDAGFDGIVTGDYHSIDQDEEIVALDKTALTVVTWSSGIDNPVVQWGSLLAYMPRIKRAVESDGPQIVTLPEPRRFSHVELTRTVARRYASDRRTTVGELRADILPDMIEELAARDREDLIDLLEPPKRLRS